MGMVSYNISSGDILHQYTAISNTSGGESQMMWWVLGLLVLLWMVYDFDE